MKKFFASLSKALVVAAFVVSSAGLVASTGCCWAKKCEDKPCCKKGCAAGCDKPCCKKAETGSTTTTK